MFRNRKRGRAFGRPRRRRAILQFRSAHRDARDAHRWGEFQDDAAARREAARRVGQLLQEHASRIWVDEDWQMDITNEVGLILYVIHVSATRTAATSKAS